jgi:hypothetical protein
LNEQNKMAAKRSKKNTRQMVLLATLLLVLVVFVLRTFVFTGSPSKQKATTTAANVPSASKPGSGSGTQTTRQAQSAATPQEKLQQLLYDTTPLDVHLIAYSRGGDPAVGKRGNIFDYYKEPPKPPPKPPDPPPITISYIQPQTAVAGTPRPFTMTVTGKAFPADAQVLINGNPRPTKRINETTLSVEIRATEYSTQTTLAVDVRSPTDPKLFSNHASFVVVAAPDPPFKYIGRIGDIGVLEMNGTKEVARVQRGGTVQGVWRVESITNDGVDVIHTQYQIKKRVAMQDKAR